MHIYACMYIGESVNVLPTPSVVIDRRKYEANCRRMLESVSRLGVSLRCHVKTHKTVEGAELQLKCGELHTDKVIVSTLAEAWHLKPLFGKISNLLFGLPVPKLKIEELAKLRGFVNVSVLVDNVAQIEALANFGEWDVFIKVDMGYGRAGVGSESVLPLVKSVQKHHRLLGFYCHAGNSYHGLLKGDAESFFFEELKHVNRAAELSGTNDLTLSVGATPTAHFFETLAEIGPMKGNLEIHAGNYPCCDLQQVATGMTNLDDVSLSVIAEVVSVYPEREEALINAGAIALSKDVGQESGFGRLVSHPGWIVDRVSQEHGIIRGIGELTYGEKVRIVPQHACLVAAAHRVFYVVEDDVIVDIWEPAKYW